MYGNSSSKKSLTISNISPKGGKITVNKILIILVGITIIPCPIPP